MKYTIYIILLILLTSCKKVEVIDNIPYTVYSIDNHKSTYDIEKIKSSKINGYAKFSPSCEYVLTENIGQINKLVGLSVGLDHHKNSIRIGWEFDGLSFKLYSYWYIDEVRGQEYITSVNTDEKFTFAVEVTDTEFYIKVNDKEFHKEHNLSEIKETYLLYPYFGGEEPFPGSIYGDKECKIYMNIKK